jgi:hypothetical protein
MGQRTEDRGQRTEDRGWNKRLLSQQDFTETKSFILAFRPLLCNKSTSSVLYILPHCCDTNSLITWKDIKISTSRQTGLDRLEFARTIPIFVETANCSYFATKYKHGKDEILTTRLTPSTHHGPQCGGGIGFFQGPVTGLSSSLRAGGGEGDVWAGPSPPHSVIMYSETRPKSWYCPTCFL